VIQYLLGASRAAQNIIWEAQCRTGCAVVEVAVFTPPQPSTAPHQPPAEGQSARPFTPRSPRCYALQSIAEA